MGHRHSKHEILAGALDAAAADGLSNVTFGRVARHLGVSDRIVVYYFPTKDDLIGEVLLAIGADLQGELGRAFAAPATDHLGIVRAAWPVLRRPRARPLFALYFEAAGLAAAGREPYTTLVPPLIDGWIAWVAALVEGTPTHRRAEAEAAIALIDGLLLLDQLAGPRAAQRAARRLGVTRT